MRKPQVGCDFFKQNKDYIKEHYGCGNLMRLLVKSSTEYFGEEEKAQEIEQFFKENKFPGAERTIQQSLERVRVRVEWL